MDNSPLSSISVASNQSPVSVGDNSFEFSVDAETLSPNATTVANDTIDSNSPLTSDSEGTVNTDYDSFATPEQENDEEWDDEWNEFLNDDNYEDIDLYFDDPFAEWAADPYPIHYNGGSRRKAKKTSKKKKPARRMKNSTKKLKGKKPCKTRSHKKSRKNCRQTRRRQQRLVR